MTLGVAHMAPLPLPRGRSPISALALAGKVRPPFTQSLLRYHEQHWNGMLVRVDLHLEHDPAPRTLKEANCGNRGNR